MKLSCLLGHNYRVTSQAKVLIGFPAENALAQILICTRCQQQAGRIQTLKETLYPSLAWESK